LVAPDSPLAALKVVGAPPIDHFELLALAGTAGVLNFVGAGAFVGPDQRPSLRRIKVAALYQTVAQHIVWL
jgi:hypothetical protein